jgi:hypothetical protein
MIMKKHLLKIFKKKKTAFLLLAFIGLCSFQMNAQTDGVYTNASNTGDGLWGTATNWTGSITPSTDGVAEVERTADLGGVDRSIGQLFINANAVMAFSNGTFILNGTIKMFLVYQKVEHLKMEHAILLQLVYK